jgi:hypothetical protein
MMKRCKHSPDEGRSAVIKTACLQGAINNADEGIVMTPKRRTATTGLKAAIIAKRVRSLNAFKDVGGRARVGTRCMATRAHRMVSGLIPKTRL